MSMPRHSPAYAARIIGGVCGMLPLCVWAGSDLRITASSNGPVIAVQAFSPQDVAAVEVVWRQVPGAEPVVEVTRGALPHEGRWLMLDQVLEAGMGAYLDARLRYSRAGVATDMPAMALAGEMNAMIMAASRAFGAEGVALSASTMAQLTRFSQLDWSATAELPSVRSGAQDKYLVIYRVLEAQRGELDRQLHTDLIPLASVTVWGDPPPLDPRTSYPIASTCGTVFDADNFMCALELALDESALPVVEPLIDIAWGTTTSGNAKGAAKGAAPRIPKRDAWLRDELAAINDRLDAIERAPYHARLEERVRDLEDALASLRLEVEDTRAPEEPWELPGSVNGQVIVRFDTGSILPADQKGALDLLAMQLAAMPGLRVAVYGLSVTEGGNIRLAEQRAAAIRAYMLQKGVGAEQVLSGIRQGANPSLVLVEALP